ncbi:MAG TPA: sensor domain-containing diguanylate cyclase [Sulfurihydrogenibium sp.]|uniref:sensor domain-containing diguanylate cyclase n=1 Tax=Sulfurihydrogenibium sp. (strain YO3AOP1) TaxID=436114 RepID=UPI000172664F|nr:sensor domain-containing diguanylate cyclase [Sulfurihydrogenibium sp. YO3AOP1]ACD67079.1 diguanylate cyclase [Sulfurihydrogenibium sp. YO3AOP1]HBT98670.1 sensor domain-containing diguanylate cyclase [Sulfurihydrogenibium sp.]
MEFEFSEEKIDTIFVRLLKYAEKNFKSAICKETFLKIKYLVKDVLRNKNKISEFQQLGCDLFKLGIIFNEAISIFDFLRKNFIAHLPNAIDLREAKRIERLYEEMENHLAIGYLKNEVILLKNRLEFLEEYIISKDIHLLLANPFKAHINYFKDFLNSILDGGIFSNISHQSCAFGIWLKEKGKEYIDEEHILKDLKHLHKDFHNLIEIAESYKKNKKFKDLYFMILNIQNIMIWIGNEFLYLNTKFIKLEMSIDPLTGAFNRRGFEIIIQKLLEISQITDAPITLAMADLDYFKKINDTFGHLAGDEALKHFVNIIKRNLRKSDYVFRIGGEEFLILLPNTELKDAVEIVERIRKDLEENSLHYDGKEIKITASFGLAEVDKEKYINEIIKKADEKLYKAKESGRNKVVV